MRATTSTARAGDGHTLATYTWEPDARRGRGVIQIAHGMAEHAARYARLAEALVADGWIVRAHDHRGHGKTADASDLGWFGSGDAWSLVVRDYRDRLRAARDEHPGLPVVAFGHSMGSYVTQQVLFEEPSLVEAAALSGTSGKPDLLATAGRLVARAERLRLGERGKSALLTKLSFGAFNEAFAPNRTPFDWLSRDPAEVDAYAADPRCGFECTTTMWVQLLDAMPNLTLPSNLAHIPKALPVYVFAGAQDPVGGFSKSVRRLLDAYRTAGLRDVTFHFYAGGRHEMLNETNRDEVVRDLRTWLDEKLPARASAAE